MKIRKDSRSNRSHDLLLLLVCLGISLFGTATLYGQEDEGEISPELKRKVAEAKAKKEIAEARKAEMEAMVPIPDADSIRTSTEFKEIKGEFIESRIQGYKAMSTVADKLACRTRSRLGSDITLIIYRPEDAAMIHRYLAVEAQLSQLEQWYNEVNTDADRWVGVHSLGATAGGIPAFVPLLVDLAKLFQRQETYSPTVFDITDRELVAVFFDRFKTAECTDAKGNLHAGGSPRLYYPATVPISLAQRRGSGSSDLLARIVALELARNDAEKKIANLGQATSELVRAKTDFDQLSNNKNRTAEQNAVLARLSGIFASLPRNGDPIQFRGSVENLDFKVKTLRELYKGFLKKAGIPFSESAADGTKPQPAPTTPPAPTPSPVQAATTVYVYVNKEEPKKPDGGSSSGGDFFSIVEAESLYKLLANPKDKAYWLQMSVSKAGGNTRVVSIPLIDIFAGSRIRFSGGAIVTFNIFEWSGNSADSGVISAYEEYTSSKDISGSLKN